MKLHRKFVAKQSAFTLIELLIVVAIIGILAAIAIPNFLDAQIRAKVAAVRSDMRTMSIAAESYSVDHGGYPPHRGGPTPCSELAYHRRYAFFTTPIEYMTTVPGREVFIGPHTVQSATQDLIADTHYLTYTNFFSYGCTVTPPAQPTHALWAHRNTHSYLLRSRGPDSILEVDAVRNAHFTGNGLLSPDPFLYDPTNGTVSRGEIIRTAKESN